MNLASILPGYQAMLHMMMETPQSFGGRFVASKYARPYRYKSHKVLANWRSGNKKKLHQYVK